MSQRPCVFCAIIARQEPATIRYEDEQVVVFDNRLRWTPVMLLVVPKQHMTQEEMWSNGVIAHVGRVAVQMGQTYCPNGYRMLSNVGWDAMQSQEHAHLHVLGGMHLGPYA
ncbi:Purine nucleoside phosphoramidase [bacterium HR23]|nr:Purine nucleoside phosphoramidase [bacterium HR23]